MNAEMNPPPLTQREPRRPNYLSIWIGVLLLVILLVAAFLSYRPSTKPVMLPTTDTEQQGVADGDSDLAVYYYTVGDSTRQNTQYKIFKASANLEQPDSNTHTVSIAGGYPSVITDSWKKNAILFVSNLETQALIYALDVSAQHSEPQTLLTIPLDSRTNENVGGARFVDDGTAIAFITADGRGEQAEHSVLHIVSLQDQSKKERYPLSEKSPLYSGFGFLAATLDRQTIYLHETGGDGGAIWSQWYTVDRTTKAVQQLKKLPRAVKGGENPAVAVFSPDRSTLAYIDFSAVVAETDLDLEDYDWDDYIGPCLKDGGSNAMQKYQAEGGVIMLQDLQTGTTKEVFRNLSYSNNYCKNVARRIISLQWLDNTHIVFETIDGVYTLDVNTQQQQTLFSFERVVNPGQQARPPILSVQLPFIVFSDLSIAHVVTNKRLKFVAAEVQKGYFFVSK